MEKQIQLMLLKYIPYVIQMPLKTTFESIDWLSEWYTRRLSRYWYTPLQIYWSINHRRNTQLWKIHWTTIKSWVYHKKSYVWSLIENFEISPLVKSIHLGLITNTSAKLNCLFYFYIDKQRLIQVLVVLYIDAILIYKFRCILNVSSNILSQ